MTPSFLSARRAWFVGIACVAALAAALGMTAATTYALAAGASSESPGVREALSHQLQAPGPVVVSQGGSGGTGDASAPTGELVASLSTAFSDTWRAPHVPLVRRIFNTPVNYRGSNGAWHAIDSALVASPLGGYENAANSFSLRLPESLSASVSLTGQGGTASFALQGASASLPSVSGDTASYAEALPSTDLSYVSEPAGVQEVVTLKSEQAPSQLRYALSLPAGFSPRSEADGSIALVNGAGTAMFSIPAATAYRPNAGPASGRVLPSTIAASGSGWELTVDTGEAWLREALASGTMAVDPTVFVSAAQACSLAAESPTTSKCSSSELRVGYDSTHQENHALLEFDLSEELPVAANVLSAKLGLYATAHSTGTGKAVGVYRVTKPWTTSATWNTYDGTHSWSTAGGDYANPETESDASVNPSVGAATGWYYWYPTKMVQEWVNTTKAPTYEGKAQGYANEGLIVKDQTDNQTPNMLTVDSPSAASDQPYLEIAYQPRGVGSGSQYTMLSTPLTDKSTMGVNVANGNLVLQSQQLRMSGVAGLGYDDARTWNGINGEKQEYGHWADSSAPEVTQYGDGSIGFEDGSGAWFEFKKESSGKFLTPPAIKAVMCAAGSPEPCPATLPTGVTYELIYDQSQEKLEFTSEGKFTQEDRYGHKVASEFISAHTVAFTDPQGHKIDKVEEGAEGYVSELKDLSGERKLSFTYKNFGEGEPELETATEADGKKTSYEYGNYTITKITDPDGHVTKLVYDSQRRIKEIIRTTNAEHTTGPTTKLTYYEPGKAPAPCTESQQGTIVRDADWTTEKEHEVLYCSNVFDEVEKTVAYNKTEKLESSASYNPFGDQILTTAASPGGSESGNNVSLHYDEFGINLECVVTGTSSPESKCPSHPSKSALVTSFSYKDTTQSDLYLPTQVENPENTSTVACYNGGKQPEESKCPGTATGPTGSLATERDELAEENKLSFEYNESGTLNGTIKASTDADGHKTTYEYDEKGNLKKITPPTGSGIKATTITVDADSRPHVITDGAGHIETLTYDADDRVTKIEYTGTGTAKTVTFEYDGDGNVTKREDSTGTTKYTVDSLNRVTKEELPGSLSNSYEYDAASNMKAFTDGGGTTKYEYNGLNELASLTEPEATKATTFTYDGDKRLAGISYPSGAKEAYKLEGTTGRPETITAEGTTGTSVPKLTYTYKSGENDTGLIQTLTESTTGAKTTYSYNPIQMLTEALTAAEKAQNQSRYAYKLDGAGNRTKQTVNLEGETGGTETFFAYNAGNELECRQTVATPCSGSSTTELSHYSYDEAGEQTSITPKHDTSGASFEYNAASELAKLTPSGGSELKLAYGGTGQDDLVSTGSTTTIQSSLLGITREAASGGTSYFARTPNGLLIDERTPTGNYNPLYDAQGDIIALANTSGKVERTFHYGPYGENIKSEGTQTIPYPFGYKGGYRVSGGNKGETSIANGLYHFGERYYDPTTGRWTQQDPESKTGDPTQEDLFGFAGDDPINRSDPSGDSAGCGYSCYPTGGHGGWNACDTISFFAIFTPLRYAVGVGVALGLRLSCG